MLTDSEFKPTFSISQKYHLSEWKSTLLRIFSRTIQSKTGVVRLKNKDITLWNTKTLATRRALLHQESLLTIPFLVDDLVRLGRFPYPESKTNDVIIDICLKKVGMQHYKDRIYTSLSGGEKQRVNLARILAQLEENGPKSKVLMLDEPALIWSVIWGFSCRDIFCVERYCLNWLEWILLRYGKSGFEFAIR